MMGIDWDLFLFRQYSYWDWVSISFRQHNLEFIVLAFLIDLIEPGISRTCSKIYDRIAPALDQEMVEINFLDFHTKMYDVFFHLKVWPRVNDLRIWARKKKLGHLMMQVDTGP